MPRSGCRAQRVMTAWYGLVYPAQVSSLSPRPPSWGCLFFLRRLLTRQCGSVTSPQVTAFSRSCSDDHYKISLA